MATALRPSRPRLRGANSRWPRQAAGPERRRPARRRIGRLAIGRQFGKLRSYAELLAWLVGDASRSSGRHALLALLVNAAGMSLGVSALGALTVAARAIQAREPVTIPRTSFSVEMSGAGLALWLCGTLTFALLGAVIVYRSQCRIVSIAREYQITLGRRVLRRITNRDLPPRRPSESDGSETSQLFQLATTDARRVATAYRLLLEAVLAAVTAVYAAVALAWLEPVLCGVLALICVTYLAPWALVNQRIARDSAVSEQLRRGVTQSLREGFAYAVETDGPPGIGPILERRLFGDPSVVRLLEAYDSPRVGKLRMGMVNAGFLGVCGFVTLFYVAWRGENASSVQLLAFIIAMKCLWSGIGQITSSLTICSKFIPSLRRARHVLASRPVADSEHKAGTCESTELRWNFGASHACGEAFEAGPAVGGIVALIGPDRPTQLSIKRILGRLSPGVRRWPSKQIGVHGAPPTPIAVDAEQTDFGISADSGFAGLPESLSAWRPGVRPDTPGRSDAIHGSKETSRLRATPETLYLSNALHCVTRPRPLLFLDLHPLMRLRPEFRRAFIDELRGSAVVLVSTTAEPVEQLIADFPAGRIGSVVVTDDRAIRACGPPSWFRARRNEIDRIVTWTASPEDLQTSLRTDEEDYDA